MNVMQTLNYMDKEYQILHAEQEFIVHPAALDIIPFSKATVFCSFACEFHVEDYILYLDKLILYPGEDKEKTYKYQKHPVAYNGAILIGSNLINDYTFKGAKPACFSYQHVAELIFDNGNLITSVDQSKAMLRIRKNLDLNLRSLQCKRDVKCIEKFMNSAFVGDYRVFRLPFTRMRYLQEMKSDYVK